MDYAFHLPTKLILVAVALDVIFGDPDWLPHPVTLIGRTIAFGERRLHSGRPAQDLIGGALLAITVLLLATVTTWAFIASLQTINFHLGAIFATLIAWTALALRGLNDAARVVERSLYSDDQDAARRAMRALVSRDPDDMDKAGLLRAAIESVAENSSDGVIAPLLFLFVGGPVGAVAYKVINTLDSMIGYRNSRYYYFGRVAARLDDLANFIPARVTALAIAVAAAAVTAGTLESIRVCVSDAGKHQSPNAGYPEAAMAGALGIELGGAAFYDGELEQRARLGRSKNLVDISTLRNARIIMWLAAGLVLVLAIGLRTIGQHA